jgi:hypothetical protein
VSSDEESWQAGNRTAWTQMLQQCIAALGEQGRTQAGWLIEREQAIAALREICGQYGDNRWNESLSLSDVIQNHLARHLEAGVTDGTLVRVNWLDPSKGE